VLAADGMDRARERGRQRESVTSLQRARALRATAELVEERGLSGTTVGAVTRRASISRDTFARLFGGVEQCFSALVGSVMERIEETFRGAFEQEEAWTNAILAGLESLLLSLDLDPSLARIGLIEAWGSSAAMLEHRGRAVEELSRLIDRVRGTLDAHSQPPAITAEVTIISVAGLLRARLLTGESPPFIRLLGDLAAVVAQPYLGLVEAQKLARLGEKRAGAFAHTHPKRSAHRETPLPKQLRHAGAHRARASVLHIARNPGASNNEIARGIGISHLGQISELLTRLERAGILEKRAGGAGRPNAWKLSKLGEEVAASLMPR
jgi:AcrR family transcriptional regulator